MPEHGSFPLTGTAKLPNVSVAFNGEHWSDRKASGDIVPGEAIVPVASAGKTVWRVANDEDAITQLCIALRTVDVPDPNSGPGELGPNEIRNTTIKDGEYVHRYRSGVFHITLVDPRRTYEEGTLIGWDASGERPEGKAAGAGSWAPDANADIKSVFEVQEVRHVGSSGDVILTCASLRGQF
jgi:hypothetical protein